MRISIFVLPMEMMVLVYLLQDFLHVPGTFSLREQFFLPKLQEIYTVCLLQEMSFSHFLVGAEKPAARSSGCRRGRWARGWRLRQWCTVPRSSAAFCRLCQDR